MFENEHQVQDQFSQSLKVETVKDAQDVIETSSRDEFRANETVT
jgi:hypothetical protein